MIILTGVNPDILDFDLIYNNVPLIRAVLRDPKYPQSADPVKKEQVHKKNKITPNYKV